MTTAEPRRIETDVLVIGGGMAGAFAAITAQGTGPQCHLGGQGHRGPLRLDALGQRLFRL